MDDEALILHEGFNASDGPIKRLLRRPSALVVSGFNASDGPIKRVRKWQKWAISRLVSMPAMVRLKVVALLHDAV